MQVPIRRTKGQKGRYKNLPVSILGPENIQTTLLDAQVRDRNFKRIKSPLDNL